MTPYAAITVKLQEQVILSFLNWLGQRDTRTCRYLSTSRRQHRTVPMPSIGRV